MIDSTEAAEMLSALWTAADELSGADLATEFVEIYVRHFDAESLTELMGHDPKLDAAATAKMEAELDDPEDRTDDASWDDDEENRHYDD